MKHKTIKVYIYILSLSLSHIQFIYIYVCMYEYIFICIHASHAYIYCKRHVSLHRASAAACLLPTTHCNTVQHTATYCNTLQHTATHCSTLQHTATHCNTLPFAYNTLQHGATHYNVLQHPATRCNALQRTTTQTATQGVCSRLSFACLYVCMSFCRQIHRKGIMYTHKMKQLHGQNTFCCRLASACIHVYIHRRQMFRAQNTQKLYM